MSEVFADGEPVDPQKLRQMQADINAIRLQSDQTYQLTKTTADDVVALSITHTQGYRVDFENGLKPGLNTEDIILDFSGYTDVYLTATPRGNGHKFNLQWSISGGIGSHKLNVNNLTKETITGVKFDVVAAGMKPAKTS
jgi:hypothetical protein